MTTTSYKWSIQDWHQLIDSGVLEDKKIELLQGDIINMSPEGIPHSGTSKSVSSYLRELLENKACISEAHPITLDNSEPEPDIAIVRLPEEEYLHHHPYAEDIYWLIEIANKSLAKDLGQKAEIYARNKIAEYWVIDLVNNRVIVHTDPEAKQYRQKTVHTSGIIQPVCFPELKIRLDKLLLYGN